ncbi:RNA polymerase sigma-70 factor (ECF subfamily) [Lewinella aquimaris]|uniref:RNA polymerase sigma-70 factor (ECF subfamily) n=1 Tax=Neolewinella aquimaris TaxID=1835722 RepID=A0A840E5Q2_9BACT|nr:sigma-70 family RNA polymerase sigma factor [Neolewinella aquimaris]MBB4080390.1 RNA polymerase sigma-70 factor (ECF subfamily) [Neolewinella aquimaris]
MKEKEMIEGSLRGNERCQRALFDRYAPLLMGVCQRYCRTQTEAEDVLQDTFVRIFNKLPQYGFRGSFAGWARRLCVNVALKMYQRKRFTFEQTGLDNTPDLAGAPTAYADLGEQELLELIRALPDGYRIVFNMYAIEGYSHKEIGEQLGIQEASSRSQLLKARKVLQQQIELRQRIAI